MSVEEAPKFLLDPDDGDIMCFRNINSLLQNIYNKKYQILKHY
jgi:hypothetical protein